VTAARSGNGGATPRNCPRAWTWENFAEYCGLPLKMTARELARPQATLGKAVAPFGPYFIRYASTGRRLASAVSEILNATDLQRWPFCARVWSWADPKSVYPPYTQMHDEAIRPETVSSKCPQNPDDF
jgi:hypothetical protein